jgi:AcrR family transcriptional regulator
VKPPQQQRSLKTLERLLDAAEELITEHGTGALTVGDVVRRAESSVGAFYARFADKDALLATLHQRSCDEALATADLAFDPDRWSSANLATAMSEVILFTLSLCRARRGLLLAFIAMAAADVAYAERRAKLETEIADRLHAFLVARKGEVTHPDLRVAATVMIRMILSTLEYGALVFRGATGEHALTDDRMAAELCRAMLCYLGARAPEPVTSKP